ncbi:hypothetical protein [Mucilaginibacter pedocola]|uniref:Uncharacterized protein n=1 Tax=Mucilaginibacter pedocola TaxID=1792845 RepID=A0A1S9PIZ1_9SPHI|nr:hypothetical protein [Mucilaginibacter pedocola]OOQ60922.1 hypothetical protein BC343_23460 [Mucilaginibacter pedocola]
MSDPVNPNQLDFNTDVPEDTVGIEGVFVDNNQKRTLESEKLKSRKQDRKERKSYAHKIFVLMCMWLFSVVIIIVASGNGSLYFTDSVLIAILTTSSANVIGLFILVSKYLFNPK